MHLNARYKDPRNLKELLTEFKVENVEFENWIDIIPGSYRWWFVDTDQQMKLEDKMLGETIYPSGLRYNDEMLLYLLTSGKLVFVKYFFKNYTETNTRGFKLKEILENIIDEDWFTEQKRQ
ncbi:30205_t:CDS:1, partial [Racocetra persica]